MEIIIDRVYKLTTDRNVFTIFDLNPDQKYDISFSVGGSNVIITGQGTIDRNASHDTWWADSKAPDPSRSKLIYFPLIKT